MLPQMVMVYKKGESTVDPSKIEINIQQEGDTPSGGDPTGTPAHRRRRSEQEKADDAAQVAAGRVQGAAGAEAPKK